MCITRAQIARQLLAEGGMSLNDAKAMAPEGEFLAYINPKEADMLKAAGGSGIMTPMGIPSFVDFGTAGSGYGSMQDTFDSAAGRGGSRTGPGGGQGPSRSDTGTDTDDIYQQSSETNRAIAKANRSFAQKVADTIKSISRFSPLGLITRGIGNLFNKLGTLRGFNPNGTPRTQAQFEQARRDRQRQNRITNIMGRDAPFTQMTLDNLAKLGYTGPLEGLLGSTNITRSGTTDDVYPDRVDGINATNAANNLRAEQLSFPFDTFNIGDPYKDNLYDQDGNYKPSSNNLFADVSQMDLDLMKSRGAKMLDFDTFKTLSNNPTLTQEEFEGIKSGTIKAPTGIYVG